MFIASILVSEFIARAHCESFDVPAYAQPWLHCVGDETIIIHSYWNVPCGDTSSKTLIDVCVCVRRHIAKLRQE